MEITEELVNRLIEHVKTARPVTRDIYVIRTNLGFTVNHEYIGYSNVKTTRGIDTLSKALVTHLKFYPVKDEGLVILQPAEKGEDGAAPFHRSRSNRTGTVSLRPALISMDLKIQFRRPALLPLFIIPSTNPKVPPLAFLQVKGAPTREGTTRGSNDPPPPQRTGFRAAALSLALLLLTACGSASPPTAPARPPSTASPSPQAPPAPPAPPAAVQPPAPAAQAQAWVDASASPFAVRGVVEGFFGTPWTQAQRLATFDFMAHVGLNTYVYAPKDDPYQRDRWRRPYPGSELARFRALLNRAQQDRVNFVYSISPGLDVTYSSDADRQALAAKLDQLRSLGIHSFMLSLDDVPEKLKPADAAAYGGDYARAQAEFANAVVHAERAKDPAFTLWLTPSHYWGLKPDPYLTTMGARLDPAIALTWTGPDVISATITAADADAIAAVLRRKPLIWDNYPVNDYTYVQKKMPRLILGALRGRAPDLAGHVAGFLANPMLQAEASQLPLYTTAAYLARPAAYDPAAAWRDAARHLASSPDVLLEFAAFAQISGVYDQEAPVLAAAIDRYRPGAPGDLPARCTAMTTLPDRLRAAVSPGLWAEVQPWAEQLRAKGETGLLALAVDGAVARHDGATVKAKLPQLKQALAGIKAGNATAYIGILLVENFADQVIARAQPLAGGRAAGAAARAGSL